MDFNRKMQNRRLLCKHIHGAPSIYSPPFPLVNASDILRASLFHKSPRESSCLHSVQQQKTEEITRLKWAIEVEAITTFGRHALNKRWKVVETNLFMVNKKTLLPKLKMDLSCYPFSSYNVNI